VIPEIKIAEHLPKLPNVYVCYAWSEVYASWWLLGFVRVRSTRIRIRDFATYRARFLIPEGIPFQMQELFCAAALGVGDSPRAVLRKALRKMRARDVAERSKLTYRTRRVGVVRRPAAISSTRTGRSH
jgi:hypothetical protein